MIGEKVNIILQVFVWILLSTIFLHHHVIYGQTNPNTITFENKSGELGLVKVIGPTEQILEVPDKQTRTVNVAAGKYHILVRYGSNPDGYTYSKGEQFEVIQTATEYSENIITLHKVVDGNYKTNPISQEEFNAFNIEERTIDNISTSEKIDKHDTIKLYKSEWLLDAVQGNESALKLIGRYIETFYKVVPKYILTNDDNLILIYDQIYSDSLNVRIFIESLPTWQIRDGVNSKIIESRIRISVFADVSEFIDNTDIKYKIEELNNKWLNENWVPHRIFITKDARIALQSSINIPENILIPIEQIKDIISKTLSSWEGYSKELIEIFN